ncbi:MULTISPECIES: extracellular solute-binding protein [Bacillaceae]|uniref:extracellular solute-binding protein n=1 Tax=Bacillaceae TaxID=186817 RepID=UPI0004E1685B|nr:MULTISPECIES: extracellular solute-binding protein [Bacillaceae]MCF2649178.1 extracellular solute-binding protein [Niallia circulans]
MKKYSKWFVLPVLSLALLAGCSSNEDASEDGVETIRVLSSDDFAGFREEAVKEFNEKYPDIKVELDSVAYDQLHDKELASFNASGNAAYDIVDVDEIWTAEYAESAFIQPVTDRFTDDMKTGILQSSLDIASYKDDYYGIPMFNDVLFFYYNEEMLKKAGYDHPPKTWVEFTEMSKALEAKGITDGAASSWGWTATEGLVAYYTQFLGSFGGSYFDASGNPTFNDEKGVAALEFMANSLKDGTIDKASINNNDRQILDAFINGKTAFVSGWSFYWGEINADNSPVRGNVKVGLIPAVEGAPNATTTGSMYLAITSQSKHSEAAWKFMEFLGSKDIQKEQSLKAGALSTWKDLYKDKELNENHGALKEMEVQLGSTISRPAIEDYNEFSKELQVRLQEVLVGEKEPKEALDEVAEIVKELQAK